MTSPPPVFVFDAVLHPRPAAAVPAGEHADAWGRWPRLDVPREALAEPLAIGVDQAFAELERLPRMFLEPDGAILWTSSSPDQPWQIDGTIAERLGRVLAVEFKGSCPEAAFDRLLAAFGWPVQPVMFQLVRAGVFLDEPGFRRHAAARGGAAG